ncbi:DNA helicase OS=Streptomyces tendae OX=1932 GN=recQ PE=3 SV=1 [Streptomyces tendae]
MTARRRPPLELPTELVPAFEALRAWRAEQAREQGVPAYVIFHDATLREIATVWPTSVAQLGGISGVGEKKLATYGEGVIEVLAGLEGPATVPAPAPDSPAGPATASGSHASADDWPEHEPEPEPDDWI